MARQRMVKPEFFDSESLGACSIAARLAFIGLWVEADDYGRMKAQLTRLKTRIFPYDNMKLSKFASYLAELERVGCIKTYEVNGEGFIYIPNFSVYQTVNRPTKSAIPEPPKNAKNGAAHSIFSEQSLNAHPKERKKERSSSDFSKVTTTKRSNAESDAAADEPAPLSAKIPTCPNCGATLKATCTQGVTTWHCKQHGAFPLNEAVLK